MTVKPIVGGQTALGLLPQYLSALPPRSNNLMFQLVTAQRRLNSSDASRNSSQTLSKILSSSCVHE